jgi:crotonobetainyl-CoA:carnitine CoA-transferase CaiB-like acyl-CoA transferase
MRPLEGIRVIDFSTLLPGPLATLLLAEAGAEVIKIERPGDGDEMRRFEPRLGADGVNFALLNRGKRSIAIDLKAPDALARLRPLIERADILVEQFRPGVMDRLGLGATALAALNPRLIYCAITGYGQAGPKAAVAGHDLNYCADSGLLSLAAGSDGAPVVPAALVADIAGGAYPAVINILLALQRRAATGMGCRLDVSMTDSLATFLFWAMGAGLAVGRWPKPGGELLSGGSPRYRIYRTADDRFVATAALEDRFWANFCDAIGLAEGARDDRLDPAATTAAVARLIRGRTADQWTEHFAGRDVCCCVVATVEEGLANPHFRARGLFDHQVRSGDAEIAALPVPIDATFRSAADSVDYPALGEANELLGAYPGRA